MKSVIALTSVLLGLSASQFGPVYANEGLDAASQEALAKTQQLLKDAEKRAAAAKESAAASQADAHARSVAGSVENTQAMYSLAADVMGNVTQAAAGDPEKMQLLLQDALANPAAFAGKLSPAQRKQLEDIARKSPK